jgi:hypothetical protein
LPLHEYPSALCVTGYLGDIGIPPVPDPMDFSAWMEAYLVGRCGSHLIQGIIAAG